MRRGAVQGLIQQSISAILDNVAHDSPAVKRKRRKVRALIDEKGWLHLPGGQVSDNGADFLLSKTEKYGPRSIIRYRRFGVIFRPHEQLRRPSGDRDAPQRNIDVIPRTEICLLAVGGATGSSRESAGRELSDLSSVRIYAEETRLATALREAREQNVAVEAGSDEVPGSNLAGIEALHASGRAIDRPAGRYIVDGPPWPRRWRSA